MARPRRKETFVDVLEDTVEEVAGWMAGTVSGVLDALAPDGRAFGEVKLSEAEEVALYLRIRNDPAAWDAWITERVDRLFNVFREEGISEDIAMSVHPFKIVQNAAILYAERMEKVLKRQADHRATLRPSAPEPEELREEQVLLDLPR